MSPKIFLQVSFFKNYVVMQMTMKRLQYLYFIFASESYVRITSSETQTAKYSRTDRQLDYSSALIYPWAMLQKYTH